MVSKELNLFDILQRGAPAAPERPALPPILPSPEGLGVGAPLQPSDLLMAQGRPTTSPSPITIDPVKAQAFIKGFKGVR